MLSLKPATGTRGTYACFNLKVSKQCQPAFNIITGRAEGIAPWGYSCMKWSGMSVGKFDLNPENDLTLAWLERFGCEYSKWG